MSSLSLDDCETIFALALASKSEQAFRQAVGPLFEHYKLLSLIFGRGNMYWRARLIESDVYRNLSDLDYPPQGLARVGRMNDPGDPCFYISARKETALAEVGAKEGALVQVAGFRILNEAPTHLAVIGEYANVQKNGYMHFAGRDPELAITRLLNVMSRRDALRTIYIDKFFAEVLSDPTASSNGYMLSRALSKSIYDRVSVDGIVFPSVKDRGGFNVAVQAGASDRSFRNVCCVVVRMGRPRHFGLMEYSIEKSAERLDDNGNFLWMPHCDGEIVGMYNMTKEEFDTASTHPGDRNGLLNLLHSNGAI